MPKGILILGLNGCGKTTIGRKTAHALQWFGMDAEDYYFADAEDRTSSRSHEAAQQLMEEAIRTHGHFVLSCVRCNISETILNAIRLTVVLRLSAEERARRIEQREISRYGDRVRPGGDLHASRQAFARFAASRTEETVNQSLSRLRCPILAIDASKPIDEIVSMIAAHKPHL